MSNDIPDPTFASGVVGEPKNKWTVNGRQLEFDYRAPLGVSMDYKHNTMLTFLSQELQDGGVEVAEHSHTDSFGNECFHITLSGKAIHNFFERVERDERSATRNEVVPMTARARPARRAAKAAEAPEPVSFGALVKERLHIRGNVSENAHVVDAEIYAPQSHSGRSLRDELIHRICVTYKTTPEKFEVADNPELDASLGLYYFHVQFHDLRLCKSFLDAMGPAKNLSAEEKRFMQSIRGKIEPVGKLGAPEYTIHLSAADNHEAIDKLNKAFGSSIDYKIGLGGALVDGANCYQITLKGASAIAFEHVWRIHRQQVAEADPSTRSDTLRGFANIALGHYDDGKNKIIVRVPMTDDLRDVATKQGLSERQVLVDHVDSLFEGKRSSHVDSVSHFEGRQEVYNVILKDAAAQMYREAFARAVSGQGPQVS